MPRKTESPIDAGVLVPHASMRPRPDAAENLLRERAGDHAVVRGFNEAAARCRGKPSDEFHTDPRPFGFNEAAARCRGKPSIAARALLIAPALQ